MSSEKIFVSTLDMVDLLVPEYPESTCNYLVSEASFTRPAPRPNNDIFYFDEGPQHQQPFDGCMHNHQIITGRDPLTTNILAIQKSQESQFSMQIQEDQQGSLIQIGHPHDIYMLADPQRLSHGDYQCLSMDESEKHEAFDHQRPPQQAQILEQRTPTKSNSTQISVEPTASSFLQQTRKDKLRRYLNKRRNRNWNRKVYYDCRKKVADSRLRIKGRFITRAQAEQILGQSIQNFSSDEVKMLLEKHFLISPRLVKANSQSMLFSSDAKLWWNPDRKLSLASHNQQLEVPTLTVTLGD